MRQTLPVLLVLNGGKYKPRQESVQKLLSETGAEIYRVVTSPLTDQNMEELLRLLREKGYI